MDLVHKTSKHTNFSPPHQTFDSLNLGIRYPIYASIWLNFGQFIIYICDFLVHTLLKNHIYCCCGLKFYSIHLFKYLLILLFSRPDNNNSCFLLCSTYCEITRFGSTCPPRKSPQKMPPGQKPKKNCPWTKAPQTICPQNQKPPDKCPQTKAPNVLMYLTPTSPWDDLSKGFEIMLQCT